MKSRGRPAISKRANRFNKPNEFEQKRARHKDAVDKEENSIRSSPRGKKDVFEVSFSESESEESFQEKSGRRSQRLNVSVPEMDSEDGIESIDLFDEEESGSEESRQELGSRRSSRISPRKCQPFDSSDESDTDYFSGPENVNEKNVGTEKEGSQRSSKSKDKKNIDEVDKSQAYYLQTVLVHLEDIGGLLQSHLNGRLTKDWTFSVRRSQKINRPSSSSYESDVSSYSDLDDDDPELILSESSASDSEDSTSSSGSNFSWESECDSISSSNSWLPRRKISSSEEDSTSGSEELEETEDDFVLHSDKKRKDLRKRKYALRQINTAIRSKVAKYCDESAEEGTDSSDE